MNPEAIGEYLISLELYRELAATFETTEGNLFERSDAVTIAAQVRAIEWAVDQCQPRSVLETGTNKAMFGYVLDMVMHPHSNPSPKGRGGIMLYTFDCDERAGIAAAALADGAATIEVVFTLGDTKQTLQDFTESIDLAWIDGGHDTKTAYSDIGHAMRLGARWILIDDTKQMATVAVAVLAALMDWPQYERVNNPWWEQDARGIAMLKRVG